MKIETKFNLQDTVVFNTFNDEGEPIEVEATITGINIYADDNGVIFTYNVVVDNAHTYQAVSEDKLASK